MARWFLPLFIALLAGLEVEPGLIGSPGDLMGQGSRIETD